MKHHRVTHCSAGLCFTCGFGLSSAGKGGSLGLSLFLGLLGLVAFGLLFAASRSLGGLVGLVLLSGGVVGGRVKSGGPRAGIVRKFVIV